MLEKARQGVHALLVADTGAGKTTVVRNLLAGLDADRVTAANLVTTQLDADDTLRLVAAGFGVNVEIAPERPDRPTSCLSGLPGGQGLTAQRLLAALAPAPEPDSFWARHWTLRSPTLRQAQTLLGAPRVTDLALNVVLP